MKSPWLGNSCEQWTCMCWHVEDEFRSDHLAARSARRSVEAALTTHLAVADSERLVGDALLVTRELVTNAVRAGSETFTQRLRLHHSELTIEISDAGPGWPTMVRPNAGAATGRGLFLVGVISSDWGVRRTPQGKTVWATLVGPAHPTFAVPCTYAHSA